MAALTNRRKPDVLAHGMLSDSPLILVALDFDKPDRKGNRPGYQGLLWWQEHYGQARRLPVPEGKNPGDTYKAGYKNGGPRSGAPQVLPKIQQSRTARPFGRYRVHQYHHSVTDNPGSQGPDL